jgi:hypothetical protein
MPSDSKRLDTCVNALDDFALAESLGRFSLGVKNEVEDKDEVLDR